MVERDLPKVDVAGSSPVIRSKGLRCASPFSIMSKREEMEMRYNFTPRGVCSRLIELDIENDIIKGCRFMGGCHGNLQGIAKLVQGMKVDDAIQKLEGIDCSGRGTSCPDQLAKALKATKNV